MIRRRSWLSGRAVSALPDRPRIEHVLEMCQRVGQDPWPRGRVVGDDREVEHDSEHRRKARASFDTVADAYEARPPYPPRCTSGSPARHRRGSRLRGGRDRSRHRSAHDPPAGLGCRVTAVELGANLSASAGRAHDGRAPSTIVTSSFEEVDLPGATFDLVVSATAFHWVDPDVGIPKAFRLLRPGGWFVLVWNVFGDPEPTRPVPRGARPRCWCGSSRRSRPRWCPA